MKIEKIINHIVYWMQQYVKNSNMKGFIIGVSGGIDSAIVSVLAAKTGKKVLVLEMPIHQKIDQVNRANEHIDWLKKKFHNVNSLRVDLTSVFDELQKTFNIQKQKSIELYLANTRSRLRMLTLYYYGGINGYLITGTGNKIEDFGVGFFTKYGDGGVDISPIADLLKSHIYKIGEYLEIIESIQNAIPTDGLWNDNRSDEDQIGATYNELEWAMNKEKQLNKTKLTKRQKEILKIYNQFNQSMQHKISPIPICQIPKEYF